jgi:hypothetical protein
MHRCYPTRHRSRFEIIMEVRRQVGAWEKERNNKEAVINWRFTTDDARMKLKRLYPIRQFAIDMTLQVSV